MSELPLAPIKRLMKAEGCERVSDKAVETLQEYAEDFIRALASNANLVAEHGGRTTVKTKDVNLAFNL